MGEEGSTICQTKCNPKTSKADGTHPDCYGGWGWCQSASAADPERGGCIPPRSQTQKQDQGCDSNDITKASYNTCVDTLNCIEGKCTPSCDPARGQANNPICPNGTYCEGEGSKGKCTKLPDPPGGSREEGQACSSTSAAGACDGSKGLVCVSRCVKACDPRKGTDTNPACDRRDACVDAGKNSYLGGYCSRKPTQKLGEECNNTEPLKCLEGLNCSTGRCGTACDPEKGKDICKEGETCSRFGNVCVTLCDPEKGSTNNPNCKVGTQCQQSTQTPPGYCRPLTSFKEGKLGLGKECSLSNDPEQNCDGSLQLYCTQSLCVKACDERKGTDKNPACQSNEECVSSNFSPLGGVCLPVPTQKENETCADLTSRCVDDLRCSQGRCMRACQSSDPKSCKDGEVCFGTCRAKCDPAEGITDNKACPAGFACNASNSSTLKPGYCRPLPAPPAGPKQAGEDCFSGTTSDRACDGSKGLTCRRGICQRACDPAKGAKDNEFCATGQTCETDITGSFLGGYCVSTPTQKENEPCNNTDKLCLTTFVCAPIDGSSYCLKPCDPTKQNECPTGVSCTRVGQSAACIPTRQSTRQLHEGCKGAPGTDSFNSCGPDLFCVKLLDTTSPTGYCLPGCSPPKTCQDTELCFADKDGRRVCAQTCQADADCKDYGTTCKDNGAGKKICI